MQDWVKAEFINWSRWCWMGPWPHPLPSDHAGSAEGNYIPDGKVAAEERQEDEVSKPPAPNDHNARRLEAIFRRMTNQERWVVIVSFPRRHEYGGASSAAQKLRMPMERFESLLSSAAGQVESSWYKGWVDAVLRGGRGSTETLSGEEIPPPGDLQICPVSDDRYADADEATA